MIVENTKNFNEFLHDFKNYDSIILPILSDIEKHPINNKICCIFVKILNKDLYYLLPFNHSECNNLEYDVISQIESEKYIYTFSKKELLHNIKLNNVIDVDLLYYIKNNKNMQINVEEFENKFKYFYKNLNNLNEIVPIYFLYDKFKKITNELEYVINDNNILDNTFDFFNEMFDSIIEIEKNGICIDKLKLLEMHPHYNSNIVLKDNKNYIYSNYNIYTLTSRPSNTFSNLNFSSLSQEKGERDFIISRYNSNGMIYMIDYDAYHVNLIADIIGYKLPSNESVHTYLGKQYFDKNILTNKEYNESKAITFQLLYGGIDKEIAKAIPFFNKIEEFIDMLWKQYKKDGYIKTILSKRKISSKNVSNMNKNKIFNYILQAHETEMNFIIIKKLLKLLKDKKTKLILYYYDGFVFDYNIQDGKILLNDIRDIIFNNKFNYKEYYGKSFGNLQKI